MAAGFLDGLVEETENPEELGLAADERWLVARAGARDTLLLEQAMRSGAVEAGGLAHSIVCVAEGLARGSSGPIRHEHCSDLRGLAEPACDDDDVTGNGPRPRAFPDLGDDLAGRDARMSRKRGSLDDLESSPQRASGVVLVRLRDAEDRHDRTARLRVGACPPSLEDLGDELRPGYAAVLARAPDRQGGTTGSAQRTDTSLRSSAAGGGSADGTDPFEWRPSIEPGSGAAAGYRPATIASWRLRMGSPGSIPRSSRRLSSSRRYRRRAMWRAPPRAWTRIRARAPSSWSGSLDTSLSRRVEAPSRSPTRSCSSATWSRSPCQVDCSRSLESTVHGSN